MPTNTISIEKKTDGSLEVIVWDSAGAQHDVASSFSKIAGATGKGALSTVLSLTKESVNSLEVDVTFKATSKELKFVVTAQVIEQILTFHEG